MERGKKYEEAVKLLDKEGPYSLKEATELVKRAAYANFDETVEFISGRGLIRVMPSNRCVAWQFCHMAWVNRLGSSFCSGRSRGEG